MIRWISLSSLVFLALTQCANAAEAEAKLIRETWPQGFWRAPMAAASRSIAIRVSSNLHLAFDVKLLRTHTAWTGNRLNLTGHPYNGGGGSICGFDGATLWTMPPIYPWSSGETLPPNLQTAPAGVDFQGISTKGGGVTLLYTVLDVTGQPVRVHESARAETHGSNNVIVRRWEIGACVRPLWLLAHAEMGKALASPGGTNAVAIQREKSVLLAVARGAGVAWQTTEQEAAYEVEQTTDASSQVGPNRIPVKGHEARAYLRIPPRVPAIAFEIATTVCADATEAARLAVSLASARVAAPSMTFPTSKSPAPRGRTPLIVRSEPAAGAKLDGDEFYEIEHFPIPRVLDPLVGGMDWLPNGDLALCTWPGEVYILQGAQGAATNVTYRRFAGGFNEALSLKVINGQIYIAQKPELTRLSDTDGDGEADWYECVNDDWGFSGNLHSFTYGPALDAQGNFYLTLDANLGLWETPFRGWAVKITPDGRRLEGVCAGLRTPNGIGSYGPDRDIFCTDNEGHWIGTCRLNHLRPGKFFGYPSATPLPHEQFGKATNCDPPAVWLPRKLCTSASGFETMSDARFGPFQGQMLVADFGLATVLRVALEKVNGEWQGAVWPFAKGFPSGPNRLSMGPDGRMYVGCLKRGWSSAGPREFSLERLRFTGRVPFEVKEVHAQRDGLELIFTQPVDAANAASADNYAVSQHNYKFHAAYGSPEIDHQGKENSATAISVTRAEISPDGLRVRLVLAGWRAGYVTNVRCLVNSAAGKKLWHDTFHYTLNQIPK